MTTTPRRKRLDLNSAGSADLARVPGLDADLAQRIVAHRPFGKLKELLRVPGVEPELYERVAPYLRVVIARDVIRPPSDGATTQRKSRPRVAPTTPPRRRARPKPRPEAVAPASLETAAAPPQAEPVHRAEALRFETAPAIEDIVHAPDVIIVEPEVAPPEPERRLMPTSIPANRALVANPVAAASDALFNSYAGPRLMFALFSVTLALIVVGFSTGRLTWASSASPPSPSPEVLATQISAAVAATFTAMPTETAPPPTPLPTPAPTLTPEAAPSPTPNFVSSSGLIGAGTLLFNETFVPPGYWNIGENDFSNLFIADGALTIEMKLPGAIAWAVNGFAGQDFYYQGTARVGACRAGDYYGLVFRSQNDANLYLFGVSCDGEYRVVRRENGEFRFLVDFTFAPEIVAGSDSTNLLAVRATGGQMSFFVNDHFLTSLGDAGVASGLFGVFAKSYETSNLRVDFDDLSAWELSP